MKSKSIDENDMQNLIAQARALADLELRIYLDEIQSDSQTVPFSDE